MILFAALTSLMSMAQPQERRQVGGIMGPYEGQVRTNGPATFCGNVFALRLAAGETVDRQEGPDFALFYVGAADGRFLLYEGGFPQPHDDEIRVDGATLIAIHDNRPTDAKARSRVRDRVLTGDVFRAACPPSAPAR